MDVVAVDPLAAFLAAGEGKFEWSAGHLEKIDPTSDEHDQTRNFLDRVVG